MILSHYKLVTMTWLSRCRWSRWRWTWSRPRRRSSGYRL